jgi:oligopeptide/dipeptide ABC transporter ATP-binding protein
MLQLLPAPPVYYAGGEINFQGTNLLQLSRQEIRKYRGNQISMIFQEPMSALNPVFTIGNQLAEVFQTHLGLSARQAWERGREMLERVAVPAPAKRMSEYPYQLSGGMRQRVMIAMAMACRPKLLIADEPTTALDVTIQAQIVDMMEHLQRDLNSAILLISHDLGLIAEMAHRIIVMYTGRIMEAATTMELFSNPLHPYTRGLMKAVPSRGIDHEQGELYEIPGVVPSLTALPRGCRFHPRCLLAADICRDQEPRLETIRPGHQVACWFEGDSHA